MKKNIIKSIKNKKWIKNILEVVFVFLFILIYSNIYAEIPNHINYQGKLKDNNGVPITSATTIQFSLYNHLTNGASTDIPGAGGPLLWSETYDQATGNCIQITPGSDGIFAQLLGTCVPFPSYLDFSDEYYLGVKIGTDTEAIPRVPLATNPYAYTAKALNTDSEDINITTETSGNIFLNTATGMQINSSNIGFSGAVYAADYSANFVDRSLVDKAYVDGILTNMNTIWDTDLDTGIQVEEGVDDDTIRFNTLGTQRAKIDNNGNILFSNSDPADLLNPGVLSGMFFRNNKHALRLGEAGNNEWDDANIGNGSFASGRNNIVSGNYSTAFGGNNNVNDVYATALGRNNTVTGSYAVAGGYQNTAGGYASSVFGQTNQVTDVRAMAWGLDNIASQDEATAWGRNTRASANYATSWGRDTQASGNYSTAFGYQNTASQDYGLAFGYRNTVGGRYATGWGGQNTVSGQYGTAWGSHNTASGAHSTAFGYYSEASAENGTAIGDSLANSNYMTAIGRFNENVAGQNLTSWVDTDQLFVIGNGSGWQDANRSNALTILKNGTITAPTFSLAEINAAGATALTTKEYVDGRVGTSIFDADADTGIQVEATPDEDMVRLSTAGTERFLIDTDGRMRLSDDPAATARYSLFEVGGNTYSSSTFAVKANSSYNNIATFRDSDGENIFLVKGAMVNNDFHVSFGDFTDAYGAVSMTIKQSDNSVSIESGNLRLLESHNSTNAVGFKSPSGVAAEQIWTLPGVDGAANEVLYTNGAGVLGWKAATNNNIYNTNGTLTGDRIVTSNGNSLEFTGTNNSYSFTASDGATNDTEFNIGDDEIEIASSDGASGSSMIYNPGLFQLSTTSAGGSLGLTLGTNMMISDSLNSRGIEYNADYSANYTNRTLVDKGYVDAQLMWEIVNGGERIQPKNNSVKQIFVEENSNSYTQFKVRNNNDVGNGAGAIIELKGSGADYTNNMYIGKYGASFWIPELQNQGAVLTDKNLVIGTASAAHEIHFVTGNSYSDLRPVVVADNEGFRYTSDLSATFIDRTLVDKAYVDGAITSGQPTFQDVVDRSIAVDGYAHADLGSGEIEDDGAMLAIKAHIGKDFDYGVDSFLTFSMNGAMGDAGHAYVYDERNVGSRRGLEYHADYSADFTNRSLVDKEYVDGVVGAANPTWQDTIDNQVAGNYLYVETPSFEMEDDGNSMLLQATTGKDLIIGGSDVLLMTFNNSTGDVIVTDARAVGNRAGIEYHTDYSADFTNRSLVDKEYVDDAIISSNNWTQVNDGGTNYLKPIATHNAITFGTGGDKGWITGDDATLTMGADVIDVQALSGLEFSSDQIDMKGQFRLDTQNNGHLARIYTDNLTGEQIFQHPDYSGDYVVTNNAGAANGDFLIWNGSQWTTTPSTTYSGNIYTANGTLTGDRTVTSNGNSLTFTGTNSNSFSFSASDGAGTSSFYDIGDDEMEFNVSNGVDSSYTIYNPGNYTMSAANAAGNLEFNISTVNGMNIRDDIFNKGIAYHADYSANFTNRSLVDKEYVDTAVGAAAGTLYLTDGTLSANRTLSGNNHSLTFTGMSDFNVNTPYMFFDAGGGAELEMDDEVITWTSQAGQLVMDSNDARWIDLRAPGSKKGIEYNADYSADYTNRSLVDKEYVDGKRFIKLTGTDAGDPVTGTIEFQDYTGEIISVTSATDNNYKSYIFADDGNFEITTRNSTTGFYKTLAFGGDTTDDIALDSNDPAFKGYTYGQDFSANYTNRSLVDKEYVDNTLALAIAPGTQNHIPKYNAAGTGIEESAIVIDASNNLVMGGMNRKISWNSLESITKTSSGAGGSVIRFSNSLNTANGNTEGGFEFTDHTGVNVMKITDYKVGVGTKIPLSILHANSGGINDIPILTLENTAGDIQIFRTDATPESSVIGSIGDFAFDGTNGQAYIKNSGNATNTGWLRILQQGDLASLWDTDADTGIQVEETADDDTIRFDSLGTEMMQITSTNVDVNTDLYADTYNMNSNSDSLFTIDSSSLSGRFKTTDFTSIGTGSGWASGQRFIVAGPNGVGPETVLSMYKYSGEVYSAFNKDIVADTHYTGGQQNSALLLKAPSGGEGLTIEPSADAQDSGIMLTTWTNGQFRRGGAKIVTRDDTTTNGYAANLFFQTSQNTANNFVDRMVIKYDGNVGIGNAIDPNALLDVRGDAIFNDDGADADFRIEGDTDANLFFADASVNMIGIGTNIPTAQLHTTGTVRFANFGAGTMQTDANGNVSVSSDERLKNIQGAFDRGLEDLLQLRPIEYRWKEETGYDIENSYYGFSAQNVKLSIPEAVGEDNRGYLTLSDRPILATAINAIKEMWEETTELQEKVQEIEMLKSELCRKDNTYSWCTQNQNNQEENNQDQQNNQDTQEDTSETENQNQDENTENTDNQVDNNTDDTNPENTNDTNEQDLVEDQSNQEQEDQSTDDNQEENNQDQQNNQDTQEDTSETENQEQVDDNNTENTENPIDTNANDTNEQDLVEDQSNQEQEDQSTDDNQEENNQDQQDNQDTQPEDTSETENQVDDNNTENTDDQGDNNINE